MSCTLHSDLVLLQTEIIWNLTWHSNWMTLTRFKMKGDWKARVKLVPFQIPTESNAVIKVERKTFGKFSDSIHVWYSPWKFDVCNFKKSEIWQKIHSNSQKCCKSNVASQPHCTTELFAKVAVVRRNKPGRWIPLCQKYQTFLLSPISEHCHKSKLSDLN